ncbi:hypothetical protein CKAH01_14634 [Colletotrichum kahawae]|uniref:Uncharacterized protein n=1 Tax=Colletotrichum kahawae TaxID=34407 RepID=A0AAD9YLI7_COLKA|nr:hypothetical protein CKAH01_14634 [Colletotrichum kahawae]
MHVPSLQHAATVALACYVSIGLAVPNVQSVTDTKGLNERNEAVDGAHLDNIAMRRSLERTYKPVQINDHRRDHQLDHQRGQAHAHVHDRARLCSQS